MAKQNAWYQAIHTKYFPPTNHKGSYVRASYAGGNIKVSWDYSLGIPENHAAAAARKLQDKLNWSGVYIGGRLPDQTMAWVRK